MTIHDASDIETRIANMTAPKVERLWTICQSEPLAIMMGSPLSILVVQSLQVRVHLPYTGSGNNVPFKRVKLSSKTPGNQQKPVRMASCPGKGVLVDLMTNPALLIRVYSAGGWAEGEG